MDTDLYNAARSGDVSFLKSCNELEDLTNQNIFSQLTPKGSSILHIAAEYDRLEFFQEAAHLCPPSLVKHANSKGDTPLHFAVRGGSTEVVKFIINHAKEHFSDIEQGHEVEGFKEMLRMENVDGDNALHLAARHNQLDDLAILLIEADPQLSTILNNKSRQSACFIALANRNKYVAGVLVSSSNPPCSLCGEINGMTALHAAAVAFAIRKDEFDPKHSAKITTGGSAQVEMIEELDLLSKIVETAPNMIRQRDYIGWTPLHYAAYLGSNTAVKLMLKKDKTSAYILGTHDGLSALHIAASVGQVGSMEALIQACPDCTDLVDNRGRNALHAAILGNQEDAVIFIVCLGLPRTLFCEADQDGNTPLHLADLHRKKEIINILKGTRKVNASSLMYIHRFFVKREFFDMRNEQQHAMKCVDDALNEEHAARMANDQKDASSMEDGLDDEVDYQDLQLSATLIATVTFTAAFTIPGGFIQSGASKDEGMAVLISKSSFQAFVIFDVLAFFASFSVIVLLLLFRKSKNINRRRSVGISVHVFLFIAYYGMALAFTFGLNVVLGNITGFSNGVLLLSLIGTFVGMAGYALIGSVDIVSLYFLLLDCFRQTDDQTPAD